jgi:hypothetical protein
MTTINGTTYAVCTTTQYNTYEPSSNSTSITVTPQTTLGATTLMNMGQMQKNAEDEGWLKPPEPVFSLWYPWFWLKNAFSDTASNFGFTTSISLFGGWLENYYGLENPLYAIFQNASSQEIDVLTSAAIGSIVATAAYFTGGCVAVLLNSGDIFGSFLAQFAYLLIGTLMIVGIASSSDVHLARAVLIAAGWTLLSIATFGLASVLPVLLTKLTGEDLLTACVKCIIKAALGVVISTAILKALKIGLSMFIFYLANLILGSIALSLGYSKT